MIRRRMSKSPTAFILAGGLGTRLRPVLGTLPKALAPVAGQPFLTYQLRWLKRNGVRRIVLCTGYQHELVENRLGDGSDLGLSLRYSVEAHPMGTAGALRQAQGEVRGTFLVLNGDTYLDIDLGALLVQHSNSALVATLALMRVDKAERYGAVTLDAQGKISHFGEKQQTGPGLVNAGLYVCEPTVLDYFPQQDPLSLEVDVFPTLATHGLLGGHVVDGYTCDIGTPESYARFVRDVEQNRLAKE